MVYTCFSHGYALPPIHQTLWEEQDTPQLTPRQYLPCICIAKFPEPQSGTFKRSSHLTGPLSSESDTALDSFASSSSLQGREAGDAGREGEQEGGREVGREEGKPEKEARKGGREA